MDLHTEQAARQFLVLASRRFDLAGAIVFGSQARGQARSGSDTDLAVLLKGKPGHRLQVALELSDLAFDMMLETGVLIEALPLWEEEWTRPETFGNPALLENIRREGGWL
jgi:predicted nucleotidyltransferase